VKNQKWNERLEKMSWLAALGVILFLFGCGGPAGIEDPGRFQVGPQGVIVDRHTGLHWAPDPGQGMTWHQAGEYARNLRLGGQGDWRLPTRAELKRLGAGGLDPVFRLAGNVAWSSEREDDSSAWEYHFREGREYWLFLNRQARALAVRSPK
jgi:formylglycine-generating enzyme required for sulfatase activity